MEKFEKTFDEVIKLRKQLRKECIEYLEKVLTDGKKIDFIELDEDGIEVDDCDYYTVAYDGGRHPEYATNLYSRVESIYEKNGEIYLAIEETDEYEISRVDTTELADLCVAVLERIG